MIPHAVSCHRTSDACPAEWRGRLRDGRFWLARYRWGELRFGIGVNDFDAACNLQTIMAFSGAEDGTMSDEALRDALHGRLTFND